MKREFTQIVTDERIVNFELGKYKATIVWRNDILRTLVVSLIHTHLEGAFARQFRDISEMHDLRDLLNYMIEEAEKVPRE